MQLSYSVVIPLSSCVIVLILVSPVQKFTNNWVITFKKISPFWHVLLVLLITGYHDDTCSPKGAIGPQSLSAGRSLVWPAALT